MFKEAGQAQTDEKRLSLERIEEAARCIYPVFLGSPQSTRPGCWATSWDNSQRPEYRRMPPLLASALA